MNDTGLVLLGNEQEQEQQHYHPPFIPRHLQQPIHIPALRQSDLNETHSRYDRLVAASSHTELMIQWSLLLAVTVFVTIFVSVVLISIVVNRRVRRSPFNLYLAYLYLPDLFMSSVCVVSCALNLSVGQYYSAGWCHFQSFYLIFGIGANAWLNAIVAWQLHMMLRFSKRRMRYFPPKRRTVVLQALGVYTWAAFVALWPYISGDWLPHKTALQVGLSCVPVEYNRNSSIFFFCVFLPCFAMIPVLYVLFVAFDVLVRKLLPRNSRRGDLTVYFFRLILVFGIMWLPCLVLIFIAGSWVSPWVQWTGAFLSHFQGAVSASVSLMKPDIGEAARAFVTCRIFTAEYQSSRQSLSDVNSSVLNMFSSFWFNTSASSVTATSPSRPFRILPGFFYRQRRSARAAADLEMTSAAAAAQAAAATSLEREPPGGTLLVKAAEKGGPFSSSSTFQGSYSTDLAASSRKLAIIPERDAGPEQSLSDLFDDEEDAEHQNGESVGFSPPGNDEEMPSVRMMMQQQQQQPSMSDGIRFLDDDNAEEAAPPSITEQQQSSSSSGGGSDSMSSMGEEVLPDVEK